jgi:hypothetical protein
MVKAQAAASSAGAAAVPARQSGTEDSLSATRNDRASVESPIQENASVAEGENKTATSAGNEEQVRLIAYQIWIDRGCPQGTAESDWLEAEQTILKADR